ncbi:MAG: hypothetical protein K0Q91_2251 [Fibrobacteria bacterium]|jgi:hypothetical protein|nr:hypothetical protein [Fibrobacteria bacterium]
MSFFSTKSAWLAAGALWVLGSSGCATDCTNYESVDVSGESCKVCEDPPAEDCNSVVPVEANLSIRLSEPLPRLVRIYAGKSYETGTLVSHRVPTVKNYEETLPMGEYSATALYVIGKDSILVVDGDELSYSQLWWTCTMECYETHGGSVDLSVQ